MQKPTAKPFVRSQIRMWMGEQYFTFRRHLLWIFGGTKFGRPCSQRLPHTVFAHKTPLIRKLKDVEMYLQHNKIVNLKLASAKISGAVLHPGETFSFWKLIGKPTKRKGYLEGMVLANGSFKGGTGGGLCQMSNLIYWMTVHTELTVTERHRHGYDVFPDSKRTQPFGSGATCFYNYGDLMLHNGTQHSYQLCLDVTQTHLEGTWLCSAPQKYSYEVYQKEHIMQPEYWGGYTRHNVIYRKKYSADKKLIADEFVVENHAIMMYAPFLEEPKNTVSHQT